MPDLQNDINRLDTIAKQVEMETSIKAAIVDQYARVQEHRIKPARRKIVIIGLFAGLFPGILFAFNVKFN